MKRITILFVAIFFVFLINTSAQVIDFKRISMEQMIEIVKAEDELRYDKTLEEFMKTPNPHLRKRAALAAGRIGNEDAIATLSKLLAKDTDDVRQMAAFAIGEIESINAADAILQVLKNTKNSITVRARSIEAAGKIVAANRKNDKSKMLGEAILGSLNLEIAKDEEDQNENFSLLGITAVLRARPKNGDSTIAKFLGYSNWRIRADALNTLARLRTKKVNQIASNLLASDNNPVVRANAARVLGGAGYEKALALIIDKALKDKDLRVRINAIRALSSLKNRDSAEPLLNRAEMLFAEYKKSKYKNPPVENELLTIASALGNILKGTENARVVNFLEGFRLAEKHTSPEVEIAFVRVSPRTFTVMQKTTDDGKDWRSANSIAQAYEEFAGFKESDFDKQLLEVDIPKEGVRKIRDIAVWSFAGEIVSVISGKQKADKSFPAALSAYAKFKHKDLREFLQEALKQNDAIVRATAASLLGDIKPETPEKAAEIYKNLSDALWKARTDKLNDASLAILDAMKKQYDNRPKPQKIKIAYMTPFVSAMKSPDYLIRRKAAEIYRSFNIKKPDPMTVGNPGFKPFEIPKDIDVVKFQSNRENGSRSRVIRTDYKRALSRKNGQWAAILKTDKGNITIDFFPEEAPLTVDNFVKLAQSGYFNGLAIHRVVPNFVVQDGDSRGDGNGGPGWQIRCEINQIPYERGMVGMALSGKDTGGSQWFVTHSPQPHLDGGYTIFGKVNENDMKIVDKLARGDKIVSINIVRVDMSTRRE